MVSVIIPVYKVEDYLNRCIDSVLKQTYTNFELILVDDGSPDQCGEICDRYVKIDDRVHVIHKENGGLSDARNAGLDIAQGEYICFIDSDDWVAPNFLEVMFEALTENRCDICECGVLRTTGINSDVESNLQKKEYESRKVYTTEQALQLLIEDKVLHQHVWNKLYRRDCIDGILFQVGKTNEDEFWTYQVFGRAKKVVRIPETLYYYFQREGSIMGVGYSLKRLDALDAKEQRQSYISTWFPQLKAKAEANLFASCIYSGQMTLKHLHGEDRQEAIQKIDRIRSSCRWLEIRNEFDSKGRLWGSLASINFWGLCRLKNFLRRGF